MSQYKRFFKTILIMGLLLPTLTRKVAAEEYTITKRIAGSTRVETSIEASKMLYAKDSSPNVVLAGFSGEVDALTGTLLASSKDAPLLLVNQFRNIETELIRLGAKNVYLLGGDTVISHSIENDLKSAGYEVNRISGETRLETAVAVATEAVEDTDQVFLTNDGITGSLVDALAVGPVSGMYQTPILLTAKNQLPKTTLAAMKKMGVSQVNIIGGTSVVSKEVEEFLIKEGFKVDRVAGKNRWHTAEMIADLYFSPGAALVANDGYNNTLADALVSGHVGAKMHMPLLLTREDSLNSYTEKYLLKSSYLRYVLGGESVISEKTFKEIIKTEGEIINIDTEDHLQDANYIFSYQDTIRKGDEVIIEFAKNGKSQTTYKSVLVDGDVVENIRIHSKWITRSKNGLIYIGTDKDLTEDADLNMTYAELFDRSGWTTNDFEIQAGQINGFSESGKSKAENELKGLILFLPEKDNAGQAIHTIGKSAFKDFYFQRAKMPDTIKEIQESAFKNVNLVYTDFPSQLETIGDNAFSGNGFSNRVHFNSLQSLTNIGDEAFNFAFFGEGPYDIDLASLKSLKTIGKGAFIGNKIQTVRLPEGLISIHEDAFSYNLIQRVNLPSSLVDVDEFAFDQNVQIIVEY